MAMRVAIAIALLVVAARVAGAQETPTPAGAAIPGPAFEVASVRANTSTGPGSYSYRWSPDGRFRAVNLTLRSLVNMAYDLRSDNQLMGAPGWIASERFDIEAIPAVKVDPPQRRLMLQGLLRDRFGLVVRAQPVDVPVYALVRTRPDVPLPPTLRESLPCPTVRWDPLSRTGPPERPPGERDCGAGLDRDGGRIVGIGASINSLMAVLRPVIDRRIVDRTGLTGRYDFELTWSREPRALGDTATANAAIFAAIQDLGLRLQPVLSPAEGYVIERIDRPTPN
jgi:uncharacterized protein (TIGR03435 family)